MDKKNLENLREIFEKEIEKLGYEMIDVEFVKEQGDNFLRFFIYQEKGITAEDCQRVSEVISPMLDELDPIDTNYYLEVSSPDLNRPLKSQRDFERNYGESVQVRLFNKLDGKKVYVGNLVSSNDDEIIIDLGNETMSIKKDIVATVKINIVF